MSGCPPSVAPRLFGQPWSRIMSWRQAHIAAADAWSQVASRMRLTFDACVRPQRSRERHRGRGRCPALAAVGSGGCVGSRSVASAGPCEAPPRRQRRVQSARSRQRLQSHGGASLPTGPISKPSRLMSPITAEILNTTGIGKLGGGGRGAASCCRRRRVGRPPAAPEKRLKRTGR